MSIRTSEGKDTTALGCPRAYCQIRYMMQSLVERKGQERARVWRAEPDEVLEQAHVDPPGQLDKDVTRSVGKVFCQGAVAALVVGPSALARDGRGTGEGRTMSNESLQLAHRNHVPVTRSRQESLLGSPSVACPLWSPPSCSPDDIGLPGRGAVRRRRHFHPAFFPPSLAQQPPRDGFLLIQQGHQPGRRPYRLSQWADDPDKGVHRVVDRRRAGRSGGFASLAEVEGRRLGRTVGAEPSDAEDATAASSAADAVVDRWLRQHPVGDGPGVRRWSRRRASVRVHVMRRSKTPAGPSERARRWGRSPSVAETVPSKAMPTSAASRPGRRRGR